MGQEPNFGFLSLIFSDQFGRIPSIEIILQPKRTRLAKCTEIVCENP